MTNAHSHGTKSFKTLSLAIIPDVFRHKGKTSKQRSSKNVGNPLLQKLPTELILEITKCLPLSSSIALSHTCSRFFRIAEVFIGELFPPTQEPKTTSKKSKDRDGKMTTNQLSFICMLERDGRLASSMMVCSLCQNLKKKKYFSPAAQHQEQSARKCIGHEQRVWKCPHRIWNYQETKEVVQRYQEYHSMGDCHCSILVTRYLRNSIMVTYPLLYLDAKNFKFERVIPLLRAAKIQFCPHMRSDDQKVHNSFHEDCPIIHNPGAGHLKCHHRRRHLLGSCWTCGAWIQFARYSSVSRHLVVRVYRYFGYDDGTMFPALDKYWINSTTPLHDLDIKKWEWQQYLEVCAEAFQDRHGKHWCMIS